MRYSRQETTVAWTFQQRQQHFHGNLWKSLRLPFHCPLVTLFLFVINHYLSCCSSIMASQRHELNTYSDLSLECKTQGAARTRHEYDSGEESSHLNFLNNKDKSVTNSNKMVQSQQFSLCKWKKTAKCCVVSVYPYSATLSALRCWFPARAPVFQYEKDEWTSPRRTPSTLLRRHKPYVQRWPAGLDGPQISVMEAVLVRNPDNIREKYSHPQNQLIKFLNWKVSSV